MVPLFENLVGHGSGYGLLLEPGTSFILDDNYSRITLRTSVAATQVAWTSEMILYKTVLNLGTAALSKALTPNTTRGLAVRACLNTAFTNAASVASSPNRIEAVQNLLETVPMSSSSYTCVAGMHDAFAKPDPDGSLPKLEVDSEVIDKESSGLGGFLDEAVKVAGEELPKLFHYR